MLELSKLYFGRDDAESDIAEGGLLRLGFLRTAAYEAALVGKKHLIIGRKGSGKSAICMTLAADAGGNITSLVTPDAMSLDEIRRFELQGITDEIAKSLFWRYMLGLQTAKHVVTHASESHKKSIPGSVAALRKFLLANDEGVNPRLHNQFWRSIQRLRSLSLGAFGAKVAFEIDAPSEGLRTSNQLEIVERQIQAALSDLACPPDHPRLLLLVDQLEQVWSNDPQSDAMVTGLLLAAKHMSSKFPGVRCVVFLRTDIYDALQFSERDKFRGDEMRIDWTADSLLDLALARARASLGRQVSAEELWRRIFPGKIAEERVSDYLIARTLRRPRDVIQFANLCRDTAEKNGHPGVTSADVKEAEVQFSQWKLQDLGQEYKVNYPFLADLFILFQNSGYIVSRRTLAKRFAALEQTLRRRFPEYSSSLTVDGIIDILYGIGFIGVRRKQHTVFSYEDPARVEPDECQFYVHAGFRQALRSITATDLHPYRPPEVIQEVGKLHNLGRIGSVVQRADPGYELLRSIQRAGDRILSRLDDPEIAPEAAHEIRDRIQSMLKNTEEIRQLLGEDPSRSVNVRLYVRSTCSFLFDLAKRLQESGMGDDLRMRTIARTMEDEARRLADEAGIRADHWA